MDWLDISGTVVITSLSFDSESCYKLVFVSYIKRELRETSAKWYHFRKALTTCDDTYTIYAQLSPEVVQVEPHGWHKSLSDRIGVKIGKTESGKIGLWFWRIISLIGFKCGQTKENSLPCRTTSLRKHAYSNILKIVTPKLKIFN